jgi:hypothetical protein
VIVTIGVLETFDVVRHEQEGASVRRLLAVVASALVMTVVISSPALAMYHDKIANPVLHVLADLATVAAVCVPLLLLAARGRARAHRG